MAKYTSSSKSGGKKQLSPKQMKIASAAPPKNAITGADFKKLQRKKKSGMAQSMGLA